MTSEPSKDSRQPTSPKHLIKYLDAAAGIQALESHSLLWSSPNRFRSPFEMNGRYEMPFNNHELLDTTVKVASSLIFNNDRAIGDTPLISAINRWRDEKRFDTPEEAKAVLKGLLRKRVEQQEEQLYSTLQQWQQFAESIRVCCFCSEAHVASAWTQFADHHQGIAISLTPNAENELHHAQPVTYSPERIQLTTVKEQVADLLYNHNNQVHQRFTQNLLHKPKHLQAEREWRALTPRDSSFQKTAHPYQEEKVLAPGSIAALYLGVNCSESTKTHLLAIATHLIPTPKIYQCIIAKHTYQIEHKIIT
ncbi:DUF2971 domain-containing protein [Marinagarivorans algicola]|uniref:DUF2971 domain-containing protein n=1 Tax=Marinagarivorans algicola TaxID=1513270 RepID=UPI0006B58E65|nr:DUF2971 domain-containing protein [Marinagarivorans algicola]